MTSRSLREIDTNLLVALDALLIDQSVTRAARRLHVTQSAMSQTLSRLRDLFDDPLLVRRGNRMELTPLAAELADPLARTLRELERLLQKRHGFDPSRDRRTFVVSTTDYLGIVLFSTVVTEAARIAPGVDFELRAFDMRGFVEALERSEIDLAVSVFSPTPEIDSAPLFREEFRVLARRGHPFVSSRRRITDFVAYPHVLMVTGGSRPAVVDDALRARGHARRVAARVPTFTMGATLVAASDMLMTVPRRMAERLAAAFELEAIPLPFALEDFAVSHAWNPRTRNEPSHVWLRERVRLAASALE
jgi:DNA-binding transcriptional LysR family regulator